MLVTIDAVSVWYGRGGRRVLDGVSLEMEPGTCVAVTGPSGSGKTTLLNVVAGMQQPNQGIVQVAGKRPSQQHRIALIQQTTNILGRRSALDNVALGALSLGCSWPRSIADARRNLEQVDLAHVANARANRLSGGERQRLAVARALAMDAFLIAADEPTGHLDAQTSRQVARILVGAVSPSTGVLIVTHDVELAAQCDRQLMLSDGKLTGAA